MGIIEKPTCSARRALPERDTLGMDPALATEYESLRPQVPWACHSYFGVFIKPKAVTVPPRRPYDQGIVLENGTTPSFGPIYPLPEVEEPALCNFLDEFIRPSQSSASAPILFIKKKECSLRLAVDYRDLNHITKKGRYPLPLIPICSTVFAFALTKIELHGTYKSVRTADSDECKTAFWTRYGSYEFPVFIICPPTPQCHSNASWTMYSKIYWTPA